MKHIISTITLLALMLTMVSSAAAQREKVDVCHIDDEGNYILINVADAAFDNHIAHGDAAIGDPVPGMSGYVFDANCQPELGETFPSLGCIEIVIFSTTAYIDFGGNYYLAVDEVTIYSYSNCTEVLSVEHGEGHLVYAPAPYDALTLCQTLDPAYSEVLGGPDDLYRCEYST